LTIFSFFVSLILFSARINAQSILNLPQPGQMVALSQGFTPAVIKGVKIFPKQPLRFDFIIDPGDSGLQGDDLKNVSQTLIKYFLASITVPEEDMWVNLSPYEKDRVIPNGFGKTEMGRDLLAQDYLLKQVTASLMYPEEEIGQEFWDKIYKKVNDLYGVSDIPVNTFNKVWIVPEKAVVYEDGDTVYVVESHLRVMLEEDYVAMEHNAVGAAPRGRPNTNTTPNTNGQPRGAAPTNIATNIIREIILPAIEKEINHGKNFATLRQIYHSVILATWFKRNLKESYLGKVYIDQNKVAGIDMEDKTGNQKIYQQYLKAFERGVYDYIKEDYDVTSQEIIPRKYFSGGAHLALGKAYDEGIASSVVLNPASEVAKVNLVPHSSSPIYTASGLDKSDSSFASLDKGEIKKRIEQQIIMHIPTDQQILYAQSFEEMLVMIEVLYDMGIKDDRLPYIVLMDEKGEPIGRIPDKAVLVNTNFRTDRKFPREKAYRTPKDQYEAFEKPLDITVDIIGATRAGDGTYPVVVQDEPVSDVFAEGLWKEGKILHLYAVGEKVAHVIREFLRGGNTTLFPNERAYSEGTPKPTATNVEKDRYLTLSQNMDPLLELLKQNLRNPSAVTLILEGDEWLSGQIEEDLSTSEYVVLKRLDNYKYYSEKDGEEIIEWSDFKILSKEERYDHSRVKIPRKVIKEIDKDEDKQDHIHVINIGTPDLVGHAANEEWSIEALEIVNRQLREIEAVFDEVGAVSLFTADHGNIETIKDPLGRPATGHSTEKVGISIRQPKMNGMDSKLMALSDREDADLTQIYPTVYQAVEVQIPEGKNRNSLFEDKAYVLPKGKDGRRQIVIVIFDGLGIPKDPTDMKSPVNKANIPDIRRIFDIEQGAARVGRLFAHGKFVGTREPMGETNRELAEIIRQEQPTQIHLPVRKILADGSPQYFNDVFTTDVEAAGEYLRTEFENGSHYSSLDSGEFEIVKKSADEVAAMLEEDPFYQDLRFSLEGLSEGRLLVLIDEGQVGGSEQGHFAMGIGEHQDRPIKKVDDMIKDGSFFIEGGPNDDVIQAIKRFNKEGREFHIDAFLQEAGVHASILHLRAWLKLLHDLGVPSERVFVPAIVDGRDVAKDIGLYYIRKLQEYLEDLGRPEGRPYGQITGVGPRSNHERDVTLAGRIKIDHYVQVTGRVPTEGYGFFEIDDKGGGYDYDGFSLERERSLIRALDAARFSIEREQGIERLREINKRLQQHIEVSGDEVHQFIKEIDARLVKEQELELMDAKVEKLAGERLPDSRRVNKLRVSDLPDSEVRGKIVFIRADLNVGEVVTENPRIMAINNSRYKNPLTWHP